MKKLLVSIAIVAITAGVSFAQGLYVRAGGGYGFPSATSPIGENYLYSVEYNATAYIEEYNTEIVSGSFGAGTNFNFALGYKFNENLILDFNVQYLAGRRYKTSNVYEYNDYGMISTEWQKSEIHSSGLMFNPSIIFSAGFGMQAPYARFGIIAASPKVKEDISSYYNTDGERTLEERWEYSGGMAIGFQTAVGMNWKITDRFDLYTETSFVSMTYYPSEGNMTAYIDDGVDYLDQLSVASKQIIFEDQFDPSTPYDPDQPDVVAKEATPFSYVSFQVGMRFTILKPGE